jgi:hypothetical protein
MAEVPSNITPEMPSSDESIPSSNADIAPSPEFPTPKYCIKDADKLPDGTHYSHTLYRGPDGEPVTVHYVTDLATAETIARHFLAEPVLGFDLEWEVRQRKRAIDNVSLMQLASPSRIALFHLARFKGATPATVLPPTLRGILESAAVVKCGAAVKGDATRCATHLGLRPAGFFELGRAHNLLAGVRNRDGAVSKAAARLDGLCERYLGVPLAKDQSVRVSAWSWALSERQKHYAAADAYAGLMLFHELEKRRVGTKPVSPRPGFVDDDGPIVEAKKPEEEDAEWVDVDELNERTSAVPFAKSAGRATPTLTVRVNVTRQCLREGSAAE